MRKIIISADGKVYAYIAVDGVTVLLCDDQPGVQLYEALISQQVLDEILSNPGDVADCIYVDTWLTMAAKKTRRDVMM